MSHISKQTIQAVAAKQDALTAQQKEVFHRQMQESFDEAQSMAATRLRFAESMAKLIFELKTQPGEGPQGPVAFASLVYTVADALAQEHHRLATADRLAWFASKGIEPSMTVLDAAKRHGIEVAKPAEAKPLVVVD